MTYIYLVEKCFGDPNKVYVGKTKGSRKSNHKKTYGDQIEYSFIDEINSLKYEDWEPLETFWIEYFKFLGFTVVNKRKKGGSGSEFCTKETRDKISKGNLGKSRHTFISKQKISLKLKGKPKSEETKCRMRHPKLSSEKMKRPKLTSKKGPEHKTYGTKKPIGFGENLSKQRKGKSLPIETGDKISKAKIGKGLIPIIQYDLEGNFIKEWKGIVEAEKFIKGDIGACCRGIQKTAGEYIWKFKNP
jgi:hypothetical protein